MKILFLTIGNKTVASSRVRVYSYIPFLEGAGIKCKVIPFTSAAKCKRILNLKKDSPIEYFFEMLYKIYFVLRVFMSAKGYDVIFVQKIILPKVAWSILRHLNRKVIFDFDDAIYLNKNIKHMLEGASFIIVSNKQLKEYAFRYNRNICEIISPVAVDKGFFRRGRDRVTLGWVGSPDSSRYLCKLEPVFKKLKEKFKNLDIALMGAKNHEFFKILGIRTKEWSIEREKEYLEMIDIGIMPLDDDEWSRAKAGYKLLLYMSCGISCVASPVGINNEIIQDGVNGYLAEADDEWLKKLSLLIEDQALRRKIGDRGKKTVEGFYSYSVAAPKFIRILNGNSPNYAYK